MTSNPTLSESLRRHTYAPIPAPHRVNLRVPFNEKDRAKALGAKWDSKGKAWFIEADSDMGKFRSWLPPEFAAIVTSKRT